MSNLHPDAALHLERLKLGTGFHDAERAMVLDRLSGLERRLSSFDPDAIELEVSVKERDGADQHVTLECRAGSLPRTVATSKAPELSRALGEVRDELIRQLTDATSRREPRHNRHLREGL